jgi:hypothetical protein
MIAWGADFEDATDNASLFVYIRFEAGPALALELDEFLPSGTGFIGVIADTPFNAIQFDEERELDQFESFQMDNLSFAPVPVPPALYLFGSGLLGLVGVARKKAA